ncbi:ribonuclease H2 subunit A-like [Babylonia areolata]|uniref:ribonuclease H2 subunit A-like n=1 Tax=Babylonia areolata TaxID=304850 RepID=UPI003FCF92F9
MDLSSYEADRSKNCVIESQVAERFKSEPCWLGIDEAGRGPVLGPMVYGICFSPVAEKEKFGEMGFADSKTLTEEQREEIFSKICDNNDLVGWMVHVLSPASISQSMLRRAKYNLNALSHDTAIGLVKTALDRGVNVTEVYVDTVGDPGKYQEKLKNIFPSIDITVAKKADALFPIVSAASICAKVARDRVVKNWKFAEGIDVEDNSYGSGYPGDPATKKFLSENIDPVFGFPDLVRFSWSTAAQILERQAAEVEWEDDEEDDGSKDTGSASLLQFFKKSGDDAKKERHRFFTDRALEPLTTL